MLISRNLHKKSSEVSIKTRSPPASLSFKGQATKHTTVKWSIETTFSDYDAYLRRRAGYQLKATSWLGLLHRQGTCTIRFPKSLPFIMLRVVVVVVFFAKSCDCTEVGKTNLSGYEWIGGPP